MKNYNRILSEFAFGISPYWTRDSNNQIIDTLEHFSDRSVWNVETFDFGELYTSLKQDVVLEACGNSFRVAFRTRNKLRAIHKNSSNFCVNNRSGSCFESITLKQFKNG